MANYDLPWLDYSGQTTAELLALARTHRIDSLLCGFVEALQSKDELSAEERVVLAVEALQREVNNGGFHQFFTNSSREYAPDIVDALERIGADEAAQLATEALAALRLQGNPTPDAIQEAADALYGNDDQQALAILEDCDNRYYGISGIDDKLFAFVEAHRERITTL